MSKIDEAIVFTESLVQKHKDKIEAPLYFQYMKKLAQIKTKNADTRLHMAVIGEFSTGKSTFINALLRDDLLESHVLQGTTTINTVIEYGPALNMVVHKKNTSKDLSETGCSGDEIREQIKGIHREEKAQAVTKVSIKHPSDFLQRGIVIIDTPGTNTPDVWHEEVTQNALREISDIRI